MNQEQSVTEVEKVENRIITIDKTGRVEVGGEDVRDTIKEY